MLHVLAQDHPVDGTSHLNLHDARRPNEMRGKITVLDIKRLIKKQVKMKISTQNWINDSLIFFYLEMAKTQLIQFMQ